MKKEKIFKEAVNGYGFEEIEQQPEGIYCEACCRVHKRPTKMYSSPYVTIKPICKDGIVRFYNPETV